jgi:hypothetical protein
MRALQRVTIFIPLCILSAANANADYYKIYSPQVDEGEVSAEANVNYSADNRKNLDHYLSQVYGVEYGVTRYWSTELSVEIEKSSSLSTRPTMLKWENVLAPFKPGEYWVDSGFYVEFEKSLQDHMPNNAEAKFLLEKRVGDVINTANISFSHNFGPNSVSGLDTGFSWRTKYHVNDMFEPGFEYYSDFGALNRDDDFNRQDSVVGPVVQGHFGEVTYDAGVLFGISQSAHDVTIKLNMEYGF